MTVLTKAALSARFIASATIAAADRPLLVYFGHHKCASTYVKMILRDLAQILELPFVQEELPQHLPRNYEERDPEVRQRVHKCWDNIVQTEYGLLSLGNSERCYLEALAKRPMRGFHVIRDPRDIVVSGYFSHKNTHPANPKRNPWLYEHRSRLVDLDQEAGLIQEIDYSKSYFGHLASWNYQHPCVFETRFEILTAQPLREFARIFAFLGVRISPAGFLDGLYQTVRGLLPGQPRCHGSCSVEQFRYMVERHAFDKLSGGRPNGQEDVHHHFRKGLAGDWRNYFTPSVKAAFKEQFPRLLARLGYERDDTW